MKNPNNPIRNQTHNLQAYGEVTQPTVPLCTLNKWTDKDEVKKKVQENPHLRFVWGTSILYLKSRKILKCGVSESNRKLLLQLQKHIYCNFNPYNVSLHSILHLHLYISLWDSKNFGFSCTRCFWVHSSVRMVYDNCHEVACGYRL
jgi:hypothetical protein